MENCAKYRKLCAVIKETDMIFLKVDTTVVKELKDLVKSNNRKSSFKGQGSKEDSGMDMLKRLRQENSYNSRIGVPLVVLNHGLPFILSGEEKKNSNPLKRSEAKSKSRAGLTQLSIKDGSNVAVSVYP